MKKKYDSLGVMLDFSRNGVMTVEALKRFLSTIRKMGYNTVFLYMEDTYQVEGEPYFGYMRSRYSIEEMKEIDEFCASIGIEAIPCIQVLAHMQTFFVQSVDKGDESLRLTCRFSAGECYSATFPEERLLADGHLYNLLGFGGSSSFKRYGVRVRAVKAAERTALEKNDEPETRPVVSSHRFV